METTRRSFLKIVAALGASAAMPLKLLAEDAALADGDNLIGMLREIVRYDLRTSATVVSHDLHCLAAGGQIMQL